MFLDLQWENDCQNSTPTKKKNHTCLRFSNLFALTKLSPKHVAIVHQQLNMRLGPGKATVQVWRKNKNGTERRLIAYPKKYIVSYRRECQFQKR